MKNTIKILNTVVLTELIKARNTVALWLTFLYPAGAVFLSSLFHYSNRNQVTPDQMNFINNFNALNSFFLPFYAVLMVSFFCQMEHRNGMLKHLFSLPIPRWGYHFGKLLAALSLLIFSWIILIAFTYLSLFILGITAPKLRITVDFEHGYLWMITFRSFLSAFAMLVIQYLLAMKLRNVVASVSIGISLIILPVAILFVLGVTGLITNPNVLRWLPIYDPYAYPYGFVFNFSQGGAIRQDFFSTSLLVWTVISVVIAALGYMELRRRDIK